MNTLSLNIRSTLRQWRTSTMLTQCAFLLLLAMAILPQPVNAGSGLPSLTIVSLTFDDGRVQSLARSILAKHGMKATFYINSNTIGADKDHLTKAELDGLYADGHEIGGHTINHVDLATLSDAAQQTAICNDMQNLLNWGYDVHSFAYPFGSTGPDTASIVANGCPGLGTYESARGVGNLVSGWDCQGCLFANAVKPGNPYTLYTNNSITTTTTLNDLKSYVTQAEYNGGGWVPLVFHRICDGCNPLSVSPSLLDSFLSWLETRAANYTYVRTMHQVMTGDIPPPPPEPPVGPNLLSNPSLEIDANNDSQADCWYRSNFGNNTATFAHINDPLQARTGNFSDQISVSRYSSGDDKLVTTLDMGQAAGGCAPSVIGGQWYQLSAWYKSTAAVTPTIFYMDGKGNWLYWRDGQQLPPAPNWTRAVLYTAAIPNDAQALSFGLSITSTGTLNTDDYSIAQVLSLTPPPDQTPPVVSSFTPVDGTVVTGTINLSASVTDNIAVKKVDFLINGAIIATDTTSPYTNAWNSASVANGPVAYSVRATDYAGNVTNSDIRLLTTANDLIPPVVTFNQPPTPGQGATVAGFVPLSAAASDDVGVARVDFLVNGAVIASSNTQPYTVNWNSLANQDGAAVLTAKAYDAAGNSSTTDPVNVIISNNVGNLLNNPSLEIDANKDNIPDCWQLAGYGSNTFIWTRINDPAQAHSGNYAESIQVTSRASGDRKMVQSQSAAGTCPPSVTVGSRYTLQSWYKSTVPAAIAVYYRNQSGVWVNWLTSQYFAATGTWANASYTTPPVPAGATALSFGLLLNNVGTLVTDDYKMTNADNSGNGAKAK